MKHMQDMNHMKDVQNVTVPQLVKACRNGKTEAWTSLVQLIRPRAVHWAHQFLRDGDSAEDVVQDSLLLAARHMKELRSIEAFESWFFQIVKTQAFRFLKRDRKHHTEVMSEIRDDSNLESTELLKMDFERAFAQLSQELQEVFLLTQIHQWTVREAAEFLSIPLGTVKSRLSRARKQLQAFFYSEEENYEANVKHDGVSRDELFGSLLKSLRDKTDVPRQLVKDTLAATWATLNNMKFELVRNWVIDEAGAEERHQVVQYTWMAPDWLRMDTENADMGRVSTVIHGRRMRTWFESSNAVHQMQFPNTMDPEFILVYLWRELLSRPNLVVLSTNEAEPWHLWCPGLSETSHDETGVHFWIDPSNGLPTGIEYWSERGCVFREEINRVECNGHVTRRMFDLPSDTRKLKIPSFNELLGGIGTKVALADAVKACPFCLMGLDMNEIRKLGIQESIEVRSYYKGSEWSVRYGPPTPSREILRGAPVVTLWQAEQATDDVLRHWGWDKPSDPQPELGVVAKSRSNVTSKLVLSDLYWEQNGHPYMMTASALTVEELVALTSRVEELSINSL
ncbi:RNA polymerase sigma factor [Alicyclobacillus sp. SO9]|uniref:RNA polymerase sigma factor n=1 Tax=Alicyclobacillus sp. SO9 TaxID=2665646 RepID=UPI001E36056D|nr:RNA polymerase sigma factor [Alicyclobacillus sp. SO9]